MSFGAGHIQDMIIRMRNNRSQLSSQKKRDFKKKNTKNRSPNNQSTDFPKFTAAEIQQAKKKIALDKQKERKTEWIIYGVSIVLSAIICWLIYSYVDINTIFFKHFK